MSISREMHAGASSWTRDLSQVIKPWLTGRRGLWLLAAAVLVAALVLGWNWLVAVGIAPLLVAALPCVAMCALGLCMHKTRGRSCAQEEKTKPAASTTVADEATIDQGACGANAAEKHA